MSLTLGGLAPAAAQSESAGPVWATSSAPAPPAISAKAAFVLDATAGTPLYALNPDEQREPASLTKVATALVVLRHADLDELVDIQEDDLADPSESQVGLTAPDQLTVHDLLYGLMLPSGNDAARALARFVGGKLPGGESDPRAAFMQAMNDLTAELGMTKTVFRNPAGVHDPEHLSSARDLATLTATALQDATFAEIVATPDYTLVSALNPDRTYYVTSTNSLLADGTVDGVKTGTTLEAGGCLITSSTIGNNRIITVVLGATVYVDAEGAPKSDDRFSDVRTILSTLPSDYQWIDPAQSASVPGLADELAAWETELQPGGSIPLPVARTGEFTYRLVLGPPGPPNSEVGRIVFFVGSDRLGEQPVFQAEAAAARTEPRVAA